MSVIVTGGNETLRSLGGFSARVSRPEAMLKVCGRRVGNELKSHFRVRNRVGNKLGGKRTNFWRAVSDSVQSPVMEGLTRVVVAINHPAFAQKLYGGEIRAKNAGALTIPRDPLAYGRTTRTFEHETGIKLFRLKNKEGGLTNLLAGVVGGTVTKVFYVLVKSVHQKPDPEALPKSDTLDAAIVDEAEKYFNREVNRK